MNDPRAMQNHNTTTVPTPTTTSDVYEWAKSNAKPQHNNSANTNNKKPHVNPN
jgi:hypothetical protein